MKMNKGFTLVELLVVIRHHWHIDRHAVAGRSTGSGSGAKSFLPE